MNAMLRLAIHQHHVWTFSERTAGACRAMAALRMRQCAAERLSGKVDSAYSTLADAQFWRKDAEAAARKATA